MFAICKDRKSSRTQGSLISWLSSQLKTWPHCQLFGNTTNLEVKDEETSIGDLIEPSIQCWQELGRLDWLARFLAA